MISAETRMVGLPYGEEIKIVGRTMWTQCTSMTDGQTDRQTDKITITKTVQRIASHGKNYRRSARTAQPPPGARLQRHSDVDRGCPPTCRHRTVVKQRTNQPTNKHDGSQYLVPEIISLVKFIRNNAETRWWNCERFVRYAVLE